VITRLLAFGVGTVLASVVLTTSLTPTVSDSARPAHAASRCATRMHARLFFGLQGPAGSVSEEEWDAFLLGIVTPRFPGGLTVVHASGHWRAAGEPLQRESSRVLEIVYDESPRTRRLVAQIAEIYKARFRQDSVMVVQTPADVCF
jgi:hypothetical protein